MSVTPKLHLNSHDNINSLVARRSGHDLKNSISIFFLIGIFKSYDNGLTWMSHDLTNNTSTSVQVIVWCCQAPSHYLRQSWLRSVSPYGITMHLVMTYHQFNLHNHPSVHFSVVMYLMMPFSKWQCVVLSNCYWVCVPISTSIEILPTNEFCLELLKQNLGCWQVLHRIDVSTHDK